MKALVFVGITVGGLLGGWLGSLQDHGSFFGVWGIVLSTAGSLGGIWAAIQVNNYL